MASFLDGLTPDQAVAIVFVGAGERGGPVRLERGSDAATWTVAGHPADSARVARLLAALNEAEAGAPVSVNPDNHARMEVDDASARRMVVEGATGADTLLVGEAGPSTGTVYARLPGTDPVYLVSADLASHARRTAEDWRSRRMAALDTSVVSTVEVEREGSGYRLERGDSAWTVDGEPAAAGVARDLLAELANLQAQAFPDDEAAEGAGPPDRTVRVATSDDGEVLVVRIWEPEEGSTALRAVATGSAALQSDALFEVPSWRADRIAPEVGDARAEGETAG